MTPAAIAALRQKAEAATPGPWSLDDIPRERKPWLWVMSPHRNNPVVCQEALPADAAFIAACRTAVPALLDLIADQARVVEAARDARNFVKAELDTRIDSFTVGGDWATLSEDDGGCVGEAMDCLARISAALTALDARQAKWRRDVKTEELCPRCDGRGRTTAHDVACSTCGGSGLRTPSGCPYCGADTTYPDFECARAEDGFNCKLGTQPLPAQPKDAPRE